MLKLFIICVLFGVNSKAADISFTMDDPEITPSPMFTPQQRNEKILQVFDKYKIKAALFAA